MLVAAVSLVGAATFWLTDQIETRSCETTELGLSCATGIRHFDKGWIWFAAALVAVAVPFWRRYRRGTWRPSALVAVLVLVLGFFFALPGVLLLSNFLHPVVYPVAAAVAIVVLAARRRDPTVATVAVLTAAGILYVEFRTDIPALLDHNLGLTVYSITCAVVAAVAGMVWRTRDLDR